MHPALNLRSSTLDQFGHEFHGFTQFFFAHKRIEFVSVHLSLFLAGRNRNPTPPIKHMRPNGPSLTQGIGPAGLCRNTNAITTKKMLDSNSKIPNARYHLFLVMLIRSTISAMRSNERKFPSPCPCKILNGIDKFLLAVICAVTQLSALGDKTSKVYTNLAGAVSI